MLELRPNCECCDADLPPAAGALICTFCPECAGRLEHVCPNCGGNLVTRPIRPAGKLEKYPAAVNRTLRAEPCFT
ncbi:DUF1272 domain-containing protein [Asticcacaulis sp. AC460]|uniref:DUF1272 domain-containing protein n=1 Tax=Asticcacaulis sp. AC460 TaxID=1282360 RepID=UPI0009DD41A3|nr:DUF1272 domain-containing protein [Asticcacaulis sp. AC460]